MQTENEIENVETITDEIIDDAPIVIITDPEPKAPVIDLETSARMGALIATIAQLNDSMQGLRLQIENERNANNDYLSAQIESIRAEIAALKVIEEKEAEEIREENVGEKTGEQVTKSVKRWL